MDLHLGRIGGDTDPADSQERVRDDLRGMCHPGTTPSGFVGIWVCSSCFSGAFYRVLWRPCSVQCYTPAQLTCPEMIGGWSPGLTRVGGSWPFLNGLWLEGAYPSGLVYLPVHGVLRNPQEFIQLLSPSVRRDL